MDRLKRKLREWLGVDAADRRADHLEALIDRQAERITTRIAELDKLTTMDADVGARGPCTIILSGVWRGKGYVQFYEVEHEEFRWIVEEYRSRRKSGHLRNIDAIPHYRGGSFEL